MLQQLSNKVDVGSGDMRILFQMDHFTLKVEWSSRGFGLGGGCQGWLFQNQSKNYPTKCSKDDYTLTWENCCHGWRAKELTIRDSEAKSTTGFFSSIKLFENLTRDHEVQLL